MNKNERMYTDMFVQSQRYLDTYPDQWSGIPAVVRYKNTLDENIQAILEKDLAASGQTRGVTVSKGDLKNLLALKAAILCGALYAYANEMKNQQLISQSGHSPNALFKLADREFAQQIKAIVNLANEHLEALADQAVTEGQVTEVSTSLDDFHEMIGMPRSIIVQASTASKEVEQLIRETTHMLNDQMDPVMLRFKLTDPGFHEGYERARTLID